MHLKIILMFVAMLIGGCGEPELPEPVAEPLMIAAVELEPEITALPSPAPDQPKLYTDEDAQALARMVWGEARGVKSLTIASGITVSGKCQQAAAMWTACNRYDAGFEESIAEVVKAPEQYLGYAATNPLDDELLELAYDVLERWNAEQYGAEDVGRVLPADCMWFHGDGKHNHFRNAFKGGEKYKWELPDVYA